MKNTQRFLALILLCSLSFAAAQANSRQQSDAPGSSQTIPTAAEQQPSGQSLANSAELVTALPVPPLMKFTGNLLDEQDRPLAGPVGVTFALYSEKTGGAPLWLETQNVTPDAKGAYTVLLGANSSNGLPSDLFASGEARWLGIQIAQQPEHERILLVSVPYALKAGDAETLGGKPASAFLTADALASAGAFSAAPAGSPASPNSTRGSIVFPIGGSRGECNVTSPGNAPANSIALFAAPCRVLGSVISQSNGNIGIGNTAPGQKLDVTGGSIRTDSQFISTATTGTAPFSVNSTTVVPNLNAGLLGGNPASVFAQLGAASNTFTGSLIASSLTSGSTLALPSTNTAGTTGVITLAGQPFAFGTPVNPTTGAGGSVYLGFGGNLTSTASYNTGVGYAALSANTAGTLNSAFGDQALQNNTTASGNSAFGTVALQNNNGANNSAFGAGAMEANTSGGQNSSFGEDALFSNTTGNQNSAFGQAALFLNLTGANNAAFGQGALANSTVSNNAAFGAGALNLDTTGDSNSGFGGAALFHNTTGAQNSALGQSALSNLATGSNNIGVGANAGLALQGAESNDIYVGSPGVTGESNTVRIGTPGTQTATYLTGNVSIPGALTMGGLITFVPGQTFPGGGSGTVTSVASGLGLTGGPITSSGTLAINPAVVPQLGAASNTFTGSITASSFAGSGSGLTNVNAAALNGQPSTAFAQLNAASNTFTGALTASSLTSGSTLALPSTNTAGTAGVITLGGQPFAFGVPINRTTNNGGSAYFGFAGNPASTANYNTAVGANALSANTTGGSNSAFGVGAMLLNTTGNQNAAFGELALLSNLAGANNAAFGQGALANSTVSNNAAFGAGALNLDTTGDSNSGFGGAALFHNSTGTQNAALGQNALSDLATGSNNIGVGASAGIALQGAESSDIYIGSPGVTGESNTVRIGTPGTQTATYLTGNVSIPGTLSMGGLITFASGQTFPGAGGGSGTVTSVASGLGLTGGPVTSSGTLAINPAVVPQLGAASNTFTGSITASSFVGDGSHLTNISASTLGGLPAGDYATTNSNDFFGTQFVTGDVNISGGNLDLPNTTSATNGLITVGGKPFVHNFGVNDTFVGVAAGNFTTAGSGNSGFGYSALSSITSGTANAAFGNFALTANQAGANNSAFGVDALSTNGSGNFNSAFGYLALSNNSAGQTNSAFGAEALTNTTGSNNSGFGFGALQSNTSGGQNVAIGQNALSGLQTGTFNIALGYQSGDAFTGAETANIDIGNPGVAGESNTIRIGSPGTQTATYLTGNVSIPGTLAMGGLVTFASGQTFPGIAGGGTITGITAGTGLTGGTITASGTLAIDPTVVPELTAASNNFSGTVSASQLVSTAGAGTAPLSVNSTTQVPNLNASLLGGMPPSSFATLLGANTFGNTQSTAGSFQVDSTGSNAGSAFPGLAFGAGATGESISSDRTNQSANFQGIDFYTHGTPRLQIANNGNVGIGINPGPQPYNLTVSTSSATGGAGAFINTNSSTPTEALHVQQFGLGDAATFFSDNSNNTNAAVYISSGIQGPGLQVQQTGSGIAGYFSATNGDAVQSYVSSATGAALHGAATGNGTGVLAETSGGGYALSAVIDNSGPVGTALHATMPSGANGWYIYANTSDTDSLKFAVDKNGSAYVAGSLTVVGTVSKGGGSFKIDHPLDPADKYLYHSFVESPDMMNIYNGVIDLDAHGQAWVVLPEWFEALNRDFRYQLTSLGSPQPNLYVGKEVTGNRFQIAGGKPHGKVSWQLTGIRHDAFANAHRIPVEEQKTGDDVGKYLYPELYGQPERLRAGSAKSTNHAAADGVSAPSPR